MTIRRIFSVLAALAVVAALSFSVVSAAPPDRMKIRKMGGGIDVASVPDGGDFETMGGEIHIGKAHNDLSVSTMGGNIEIDSADSPLKAHTMGGNITIQSASASVKAETMGGSVQARIVNPVAGSNEILLTSMGGEITLTVPKNFPMTVDVALTFTKRNEGRYKVIDSLGLQQSTSPDWDTTHGDPRKVIYAKGATGSGQNHVTIKTINGNITIKSE